MLLDASICFPVIKLSCKRDWSRHLEIRSSLHMGYDEVNEQFFVEEIYNRELNLAEQLEKAANGKQENSLIIT